LSASVGSWLSASCAARTFCDSAARLAPCTTYTFHGWLLEPDGAQLATRRIRSSVSRSTGSARNSRQQKRLSMAACTLCGSATTVRTGGACKEATIRF